MQRVNLYQGKIPPNILSGARNHMQYSVSWGSIRSKPLYSIVYHKLASYNETKRVLTIIYSTKKRNYIG